MLVIPTDPSAANVIISGQIAPHKYSQSTELIARNPSSACSRGGGGIRPYNYLARKKKITKNLSVAKRQHAAAVAVFKSRNHCSMCLLEQIKLLCLFCSVQGSFKSGWGLNSSRDSPNMASGPHAQDSVSQKHLLNGFRVFPQR